MVPGALLAGALAVVPGGPAGATGASSGPSAPEQVASHGRVTLFATPTVATTVVAYGSCNPRQEHQVRGSVISFQNLPVAGCQAVLIKSGEQVVLCAGQGAIPPAFRVLPLLRIQPGTTPPCPVVLH